MNDQFGADAWDSYLRGLEEASPEIRAIAVTDYYVTETYQQVVEAKRNGRLPNCELIFPNVELRLGLRTIKGRFINLHLLVSPEDPNHVEEVERFLTRLTFSVLGDRFACSRRELIRLGRAADPSKTSDKAALEHGANQFKVQLPQLQEVYRESDWARENILIGISGTSAASCRACMRPVANVQRMASMTSDSSSGRSSSSQPYSMARSSKHPASSTSKSCGRGGPRRMMRHRCRSRGGTAGEQRPMKAFGISMLSLLG